MLKVLYGLEVLQIEQLTFQQAEKVFNHSIVQTVTFSAHALVDSLFLSIAWYCLCWYCQP